MKIRRPHRTPRQASNSPRNTNEAKPAESWSVPKLISKPRSVLSASIKLFRAAEGMGLMNNPISTPVQSTVSALGVAFYGANAGAELLDGDYKGALKDFASGAVSFTAGAKLLGVSRNGARGMYAAGAALNFGLALEELNTNDKLTGALRLGNSVGLLLSAANGLFRGPLGVLVGPASQAVLGTVGIAAIIRDLSEKDGLTNRPDMFS